MTDQPDIATMTYDEHVTAVHALARDGHSDHEIARLTRLHVEQVRRLLAVQTDHEAAHRAAWSANDAT